MATERLTEGTSVVLTGAASGIGRATAEQLSGRGVALELVDRDREGLEIAADALGGTVRTRVCDLSNSDDRARLCDELADAPPDVLINNAGILNFSPLETLSLERIETEFQVNVITPIALSRAVIPKMRTRGSGAIVNVGSIFGSIAFAYFATYSSSKFAIRGFSQALRRELEGSGIDVCYVAPRATRTNLASQFGKMAELVHMRMDDPEVVARSIVNATETRRPETYVGFPESFFVRVNALFPGIVDRALRSQNEEARPFAVTANAAGNGGR
jgi:short-subunit dehydrogenase